jgi:hypothetical protein
LAVCHKVDRGTIGPQPCNQESGLDYDYLIVEARRAAARAKHAVIDPIEVFFEIENGT